MKKKALFLLSLIMLFGLNACDNEDTLIFTARQTEEGVSFSNTFSAVYLLSKDTKDNIAERFVWDAVDFDAPVNITYELQASIDPEFQSFDVVNATTETNLAVTVGLLLDYAEQLGLDDDPATPAEGSPNNSGEVYFRLRAYTGTGAANAVDQVSDIQPLSIKWIEKAPTGTGCPSIYAVGDGMVNVGWGWTSPTEFYCDGQVYSGRAELTNNAFRFFTESGNWDTGLNYPYYANAGYTIDANLIDAQDNDNNFEFVGTPGMYGIVVDDNAKTITLTPSASYFLVGDAVPGAWGFGSAVTATETSPYIRTATLDFTNGIFRFFTESGNWNSGLSYAYFEDLEYTIDDRFEDDGGNDSNFRFTGTPGNYTITINDLEKTITLQ